MKKAFFIGIIFISILSFSQKPVDFFKIKYKTLLLDEREDFGCFYYEENTLITNNNFSIYYEQPKDTIIETLSLGYMSNEDSKYKYTYFKDLKNKLVYYDRNYGAKKIIVDSTFQIKWTITNNFKEILNYKCQEAIGDFRGRKYKAYFLKSIPIMNGPFKFDGLPGIILMIESLDQSVSIKAYEIEFNESVIQNFDNPFKNSKNMSWLDFKEFYKKRIDKVNNFTPEDGVYMSIPKGYIEDFTEE